MKRVKLNDNQKTTFVMEEIEEVTFTTETLESEILVKLVSGNQSRVNYGDRWDDCVNDYFRMISIC